MHSRDRVRKTLEHVRPDRPPADGTFRSQVWQALRAHLSTHDDDQIMDALGHDFRRAVLEPSHEFAATAVPAPVEVGVGAGTRNLVRLLPNGVFEDDRGLRRVVDSTQTYFHYVDPPLGGSDGPEAYAFPNPDLPERYAHLVVFTAHLAVRDGGGSEGGGQGTYQRLSRGRLDSGAVQCRATRCAIAESVSGL